MTSPEFYLMLDEIIEVAPGTVVPDSVLSDLASWDSLAVLSFIALADERLKAVVSGNSISGCRTGADLLALVQDKITE